MDESSNIGSSPTPVMPEIHPQQAALQKLKVDRDVLGVEAVTDRFRMFDRPRPYVTVIGFAVDSMGRFPIFRRSDKVRSAKNAWSMPSGLHEVGYTHEEQFGAELSEELGLTIIPGTCRKIGFYEAIIYGRDGEDNWHWVLLMMAMRVRSLENIQNREPDKHSDIQVVTTQELYGLYMKKPWTMNLKEALLEHRLIIDNVVRSSSI